MHCIWCARTLYLAKLSLLPFADHSVSHSILSNTSIGEDVLIFCIKARLQVLPTKYNLAIWNPPQHDPHCILHHTPDNKETMAHILNGCSSYKGLYIARHDRLVDLISQHLEVQDSVMYMHSTVKLNWFNHNCTDTNILSNIPNTPDIVLIQETIKSVTILEIGCSFDLYMDICFTSKLVKYQPLVECITSLGYHCQLIVLVFGSLGHVHRLAVRGLQNGGMQKADAKRLARFCSVSATLGSLFIWRRRCAIYPWLSRSPANITIFCRVKCHYHIAFPLFV